MSTVSPIPPAPESVALSLPPRDDDRRFRVRLDSTLATLHPTPKWLVALRVGLTVAVLLLAPLSNLLLAVAGAATWLLGGVVLRYPVTLPPGRALFCGGLENTDVPGRYWLRPRWRDTPHSIPTTPLSLDWQPAPTRLHAEDEGVRWLELRLRLQVASSPREAEQFVALMQFEGWQTYPQALGRRLRRHVMPELVDALQSADLSERSAEHSIDVMPSLRPALDPALRTLGLHVLEAGECTAVLGPRTDDLQTDDRVNVRNGG